MELLKRIITSLILFPILLFAIIYSKGILVIFLSFFYFFCFKEIDKNAKSTTFKFFSNLFILISFYSFYYLRGETNESMIFLCWILFSTFLSDIGGFFFGKLFKGKKLTKISPNKTYSGSLGSFFLSLFSLPILFFAQKEIINEIIIDFFNFKFLIFTLLISLVAQIGDITVSFFKRKLNIKDTGYVLPGHGGILDRIDGLIFVLLFLLITKILGII